MDETKLIEFEDNINRLYELSVQDSPDKTAISDLVRDLENNYKVNNHSLLRLHLETQYALKVDLYCPDTTCSEEFLSAISNGQHTSQFHVQSIPGYKHGQKVGLIWLDSAGNGRYGRLYTENLSHFVEIYQNVLTGEGFRAAITR